MIILDCNIMIDIINRKIIKKIGFKLTEFVSPLASKLLHKGHKPTSLYNEIKDHRTPSS